MSLPENTILKDTEMDWLQIRVTKRLKVAIAGAADERNMTMKRLVMVALIKYLPEIADVISEEM